MLCSDTGEDAWDIPWEYNRDGMNGRDNLATLVQDDVEITQHSMGKIHVCQVRVCFFWVPLCGCHSFFPFGTQQSNEKGRCILNTQPYASVLRLLKQENDFFDLWKSW